MRLDRTTEKVVRALLRAEGNVVDIWQLSRECGYFPEVLESVGRLEKVGAVATKDSIVSLQNKESMPMHLFQKECQVKKIMEEYANIRERVVFGDDRYDQLSLLPSAIENKLSLLVKNNDLLNRDIICFGDDDLFSVACSLTGEPKGITVFDADKRVIDFLNEVSPDLPVPMKTFRTDLLRSLPNRYKDAFDVLITEPPDTVRGFLLFVSRGIQVLRRGGVLYLGMAEASLSKEQWLTIQQSIVNAGIRITDMIQDFEEYELDGYDQFTWKGFDKLPKWITVPAQKPWYVSALLRGEMVGFKKSVNISLRDIEKELVTNHLPLRE